MARSRTKKNPPSRGQQIGRLWLRDDGTFTMTGALDVDVSRPCRLTILATGVGQQDERMRPTHTLHMLPPNDKTPTPS